MEDSGHKEKSSLTMCERGCARMHTKECLCKENVNILVLISIKTKYFHRYFMIPQKEGNKCVGRVEVEERISDGKVVVITSRCNVYPPSLSYRRRGGRLRGDPLFWRGLCCQFALPKSCFPLCVFGREAPGLCSRRKCMCSQPEAHWCVCVCECELEALYPARGLLYSSMF